MAVARLCPLRAHKLKFVVGILVTDNFLSEPVVDGSPWQGGAESFLAGEIGSVLPGGRNPARRHLAGLLTLSFTC